MLTILLALVAAWAWQGRLGAESARGSALCAGGLVVGVVVGELLHRRVDAALFARSVWLALAVVGALLLLR